MGRTKKSHNFSDRNSKLVFVHDIFCISIQTSLEFVPPGPINNKLKLIQILASRPIGDKSISEPKIVSFTEEYLLTRLDAIMISIFHVCLLALWKITIMHIQNDTTLSEVSNEPFATSIPAQIKGIVNGETFYKRVD